MDKSCASDRPLICAGGIREAANKTTLGVTHFTSASEIRHLVYRVGLFCLSSLFEGAQHATHQYERLILPLIS